MPRKTLGLLYFLKNPQLHLDKKKSLHLTPLEKFRERKQQLIRLLGYQMSHRHDKQFHKVILRKPRFQDPLS